MIKGCQRKCQSLTYSDTYMVGVKTHNGGGGFNCNFILQVDFKIRAIPLKCREGDDFFGRGMKEKVVGGGKI